MKITDYIASLLPSFERNRIKDDIRVMREELKNTTLPPYSAAAEYFGRNKLISKVAKDYDTQFSKAVRSDLKGNYIQVIDGMLKRLPENLDSVERLIDRVYANDVVAKGLTFLKANLLQYVEASSFAMRYSRKLLLWTYEAETNEANKDAAKMGQELTKAEREWLAANADNFFKVVTILVGKPDKVEAALDAIPDIVVDPHTAPMIAKTVGAAKLDPFAFGIIPIVLNPIYHIRMAIAEWQVASYKASVEEKRALEYRLLNLKNSRDGKKDAKLEEAIEYTTNRLTKLNYELAQMEKDYA